MEFKVKTSMDFMSYDGVSSAVRQDVRMWLEGKFGKAGHYSSKYGWKGRWISTGMGNHCLFRFKNANDAVLFKLTWGGQ